jgi:heme/copper-type cytochrome/quinol oxidase subunit 2
MRLLTSLRSLSPIWIILAALAVVILALPFPILGSKPTERVYRVEAARFAYSPAVLKANPGDRVTIELVSMDVVHGLEIDGYGLGITSDPGQPASMTFVADRIGTFRMRCSVTCGAMHPFMIGKLQVGHNTWLWRGAGLTLLAVVAGVWKIWK